MITQNEKTAIRHFIEGLELQLESLDYFVHLQVQKRDSKTREEDTVKYDNFTYRIDSTNMFKSNIMAEIKKLKIIWDLG
jgi:hypothetical protein